MTRRRVSRLAFCLGLFATSASVHSEAPFSVIILNADRLIYRDDKEVVVPGEPDAVFMGEVYQAHIRKIKTLSGPEIPRNAVIMFVGNHLPSEGASAFKVVMVVRRDEDGYWGGQRWMKVGSRLCLGDDDIAEANLETAFAKAKRQKTGDRCIRV